MKIIEKLNISKVPIVPIDKSLEKYRGKVLFPKKLAMANEILTAYKKLLVHHPEDAFSRMVV